MTFVIEMCFNMYIENSIICKHASICPKHCLVKAAVVHNELLSDWEDGGTEAVKPLKQCEKNSLHSCIVLHQVCSDVGSTTTTTFSF